VDVDGTDRRQDVKTEVIGENLVETEPIHIGTGNESGNVTKAQKDAAVDHIVEVDHHGVTLGNVIHRKTRSARNEKGPRSARSLDHDLAPGHDPALPLRTLLG